MAPIKNLLIHWSYQIGWTGVQLFVWGKSKIREIRFSVYSDLTFHLQTNTLYLPQSKVHMLPKCTQFGLHSLVLSFYC
jgi:hypothetical protein